MQRLWLVPLAALAVATPAAASEVIETEFSVAIDGSGHADAKLTITNHSDRPICVMPYMERVFLSAADGSVVGPLVVARSSYMWPGDMPVVWDSDGPREFTLPLVTDDFFPGADRMRQAAHATYDFEAYDCVELFADRVHVRARYKRELSATVTVAQ